jgi:quercetin dioxygenase-like cupin family protein
MMRGNVACRCVVEGWSAMTSEQERDKNPVTETTVFWAQPEEVEVESAGPEYEPAFYDVASLPGFAPIPGVYMSVMAGSKVMANWVRLDAGAEVPTHAHHHEQIGLVLEGSIHMTIAGETRLLVPGQAYTIPGHVPHSAVGGPEGCLALDIFSPIRDEYVAAAR